MTSPLLSTLELFTLSDFDALGLSFATATTDHDARGGEEEGERQRETIESSSLAGVTRGDVAVNLRRGELETLLASRSSPAVLVIEKRTAAREENHEAENPETGATRRDADRYALAREYHLAAQAYETFVRLDSRLSLLRQQLTYANLAACYVQLGEFEKASAHCEALVRNFPSWPMSYVRESHCLLKMGKPHEAALSLVRGVEHIPGCLPLLTRLRNSAFPAVLQTPPQFVYVIENGAGREGGMDEEKSVVLQSSSHLIAVNGHPVASANSAPTTERILTKYSTETVKLGSSQPSSSSTSGAYSAAPAKMPLSSFAGANEEAERRLATHDDVLFLHGSDCARANGFYFPQGTRNDRPYYENASGCVLSREASSSGICAWVVGTVDEEDARRTMLFVSRPWAEITTNSRRFVNGGEGMGWVCVVPRFGDGGEGDYEYIPPRAPEIAYRVPPLAVLLGESALSDDGGDSTPSSVTYFDGKTDALAMLLMVKGHGIRLCETGWAEEGEQQLKTVVQQALAFASLSESVASANDLRRLVTQCRNLLKSLKQDRGEGASTTTAIDEKRTSIVVIEGFRCRLRLNDKDLVYEAEESMGAASRSKTKTGGGACLPCGSRTNRDSQRRGLKKTTSSSTTSVSMATTENLIVIPRVSVGEVEPYGTDNIKIVSPAGTIYFRLDPSSSSQLPRGEVIEQIMRWKSSQS